MTERYWLQRGSNPEWTEVDRAEWIRAEREAGFVPKGMLMPGEYWNVCATGGFGTSMSHCPESRLAGKITHDGGMPAPRPG